ncbi:MAG: MBL fold metallo-hydrolase [Patescibacteria group bacterium]
MKKAQIIIAILLAIVIILLIFVRKDSVKDVKDIQNVKDAASDKIVQNDYVKVTFLDIGQGDATFIEFPNGEQMLVDCAIDARIIEALGRTMEFYDKDIDYLVVTHPDLDHYGGCVDVLKRFAVKKIVYNGLRKEYDGMWKEFWQAIADEGGEYVELKKEDVWNIASTTLHFLYPDHSIVADAKIPGSSEETDANNTSVVFKLSYGEMDVLLTGDAEAELEKYLLQTYGDQLDVEILKAGHHGSAGSSIQEFIEKTSPAHTIFSAGKENTYGHPSLRIIRRAERVGSKTWRTDTMGDIMMVIKREGIDVDTISGS